MNDAVFLVRKNRNSESIKIVEDIRECQLAIYDIQNRIVIEIGELEVVDDGVTITASKERFDGFCSEINRLTKQIWSDYEKLRDLGVVKIT